MKNRTLGNTGIAISPVGYGCMGLSHAYGTPLPKEEAAERIRQAYEFGYTFFDTAECYTGTYPDGSTAYNEEAVGLGIQGIRNHIVLASKFGVLHKWDHLEFDSSPETIRKSIDGSLKRLGTDYLDLYYQHRIDPKVEPETVAEVMGELIKEGKIRSWGISAVNEDYLRRAHAVTPVSAVENMYSMIDRDTEKLFPLFEQEGITMVAFTPLAKGFLTGRYLERPVFSDAQDNRGGRYQFSEEGFAAYQSVLKLIADFAAQKGATSTQISLAWMLSKSPRVIPIPGTRTPSHMKENIESANFELTAEEVAQIDTSLKAMNLADTAAKRVSFK